MSAEKATEKLVDLFDRLDDPSTIRVMPGEMAFTTSDQPRHTLATELTNVCSGICVVSKGSPNVAGIMHVYSSAEIAQRISEDEIAKNTKNAWETFKAKITEHGWDDREFHCYLFGGRTAESLNSPTTVDPEMLAKHNKITTTHIDQERALVLEFRAKRDELIEQGDDALFNYIGEFFRSAAEIEQPYADWVGYNPFFPGNIVPEPRQEVLDCANYNNWRCSAVISETLFGLASSDPSFSVKDLRCKDSPHDFIVDAKTVKGSIRTTPESRNSSIPTPTGPKIIDRTPAL